MDSVNMQHTDVQPVRLIPLSQVIKLTGRSRSRIYAEIQRHDGSFPAPLKDGASTRFVEQEVVAWIAKRIAERDATAAA